MPVTLRAALEELYRSMDAHREEEIAAGREMRFNPELEALLRGYTEDTIDMLERAQRSPEPR